MSPEEKLLKLAGFQPIVSEAQAYQLTRNLNKALGRRPSLNRMLFASDVLNASKDIKVGSYFFYKKMPVRCNSMSKDGVLKKKTASILYIFSHNLTMTDMADICLAILKDRTHLATHEEIGNMWVLVAQKDYVALCDFFERVFERQVQMS